MRAFAVGALLVLAGCATVGQDIDFAAVEAIPVGTTQADVVARLGQPTARTRLADGTMQLLWSYGSSKFLGSTVGKATVLGFDKDGRYTGVVTTSQSNVR